MQDEFITYDEALKLKDRMLITIEWEDGSKNFSVVEKNKITQTYDKIIDCLSFNALNGNIKEAKKRFIEKGTLTL